MCNALFRAFCSRLFSLILALVFSVNIAHAVEFFQMGELPPSKEIKTVLSAGAPSDVLLLATVPDKLLGLANFKMDSKSAALFSDKQRQLPTLGKIAGKGSTLSTEKIIALRPNLIIDVGNVTPNYQDQAKRTFAQTQVPYVLLDGSLANTPALLRAVGKLLDTQHLTETQAQYAEQTLKQGKAFSQHIAKTAYLARGANGLQSGQPNSIHTEAMELVGLKNVVQGDNRGLAQVSMEQLLLWQPDFIFTQYPEFYAHAKQSPEWQALSAVKNQRIFLVPSQPFGWLDSPPSLNRLLGIRWLIHILQGKTAVEFAPEVQKFYQLFYHIDLNLDQAKQLLQD